MIPAGCTSLVQPLDVSVNKPLREIIVSITTQALVVGKESENEKQSAVGKQQILTTWCVGDTWYQLCIDKQDLVQYVFRKLGLSLHIDGSADSERDIKSFAGLEIGEWRQDIEVADSELHVNIKKTHDDNLSVEYVAAGEN